MDVTGEDDPFRPVLLWFRDRFQSFEVSGWRSPEGTDRYREATVHIEIGRRKTKSQEQVRQIVTFKVSSPPPQSVIERLAEIVQANPWGVVGIETWRGHAWRLPAEAFPEDSYLVTEAIPGNRAEVLSSDGHLLRKLRWTHLDAPLQLGEDAEMEGDEMVNDYVTSKANRLVQQVAGESLPRIPPEVVQGFIQGAKHLIEQVERHRFAEGDSVLIKMDVPLIGGEFMSVLENGDAEIRIKVPMVDVRPGYRKGD